MVVAVARAEPEAEGYADTPWLIVPRAAAQHLVVPLLWASWIYPWAAPVIGSIEPIVDPLPHIAMYVVQPPRIGLELSNRMRSATGVLVIPGVFPKLTALISKATGRGGSRSRRILPFGFCGKPVGLSSFLFTEPPQKFLHLSPRDIFHGPVQVTFETAGITPHHRLPLPLRHRIFA